MKTTMVVEAPGLGLGHGAVGAGPHQGPGQDLGLAGILGRGGTQDSLAALKLLWRRPVSWWSRIC